MLGKIEGRRSGWQGLRWLDGITDSMNMSLSKLQEMLKDRQGWHATVHGVAELCYAKSLQSCPKPPGFPVPAERRGILWRWRGPSGLRWVWRNGRGPHLEGRQAPFPTTILFLFLRNCLEREKKRIRTTCFHGKAL